MVEASRLRKTKAPCKGCGLHLERCICARIPRLDLRTRLVLLVHAKELKRTTNTGRLAVQALVNSEMRVRGLRNSPLHLSDVLSPEYDSYVLFPSEDAVELESVRPKKPVQLIVSDGNWRQASKINTRHPEIKHLPRVKVSRPNPATFHMRKEHVPDGCSTLEAIAFAMAVLEGPAAGAALMNLYQAKLSATLAGRGIDFRSELNQEIACTSRFTAGS